MAVPPAPSTAPAPAVGTTGSAIELLADRTSRAIIGVLGDARRRPLTTASITDVSPLDVTARLVRDRVRDLGRHGIVAPPLDGSSGPGHWVLTAAGEDLLRLQSLMARVVAHGAGLPQTASPSARDRVLDASLVALADPVSVLIIRRLAEFGPMDPTDLEARCEPTPRRTLYRRLSTLVTGGAVLRNTTGQVPRRTSYELAARWRPVAAVVLLSGWWEARHSLGGTIGEFDLEGLLLSVLPSVRVQAVPAGTTVHWLIDGQGRRDALTLRVQREGVSLEVAHEVDPTGPLPSGEHTLRGTPTQWSSALVTDRRDELVASGDATLGDAVFASIRSSLLAYVR
ncbi:MAG: winged helix-turn-helix transcriptional regulator [Solirubrobacteraceae bacterium]|nr:winged helix-turn-helix transcriptional regulator [Solirubrobacteraceae bacterium]